MAKTFGINETVPAAVTAFGVVTEWDISKEGEFVQGIDGDGEVDAEGYNMRKETLTMSGEVTAAASCPAVGDTFVFDTVTWTVNKAEYGERAKAAGPFSIEAHKWHNI